MSLICFFLAINYLGEISGANDTEANANSNLKLTRTGITLVVACDCPSHSQSELAARNYSGDLTKSVITALEAGRTPQELFIARSPNLVVPAKARP